VARMPLRPLSWLAVLCARAKATVVNIKMPNGQLITIPVSGDLKIGLLKSAIRKAELDDEVFLKLLKGD
jgi:hypothetical protein